MITWGEQAAARQVILRKPWYAPLAKLGQEDFKVYGLAARGWVALAFDPDDGFLHNYLLDAHNVGLILNMKPLLVMDVYEHAYYMDYGTNRRGYIKAFWQDINWEAV